MDSIGLLARILNTYLDSDFSNAKYLAYESQLQELTDAELLYRCGKSDHIFCDKCDEPHYAKIMKHGSQLKWRCPETGFHDVDPTSSDRNLFKINLERLIHGIQKSLGFTTTNLQGMHTTIKGLYHINPETLLYVSDQSPIADESLYNFIHGTKSRASQGMVLSTFEGFHNRIYALPRDYKAVPFCDVVALKGNIIHVDFGRIDESILPNVSRKRKAGRPSVENQIVNAMKDLLRIDDTFINRGTIAQADEIHGYLGRPKIPALKTIQNKLPSIKKTIQL
jgi:hypothetical protein